MRATWWMATCLVLAACSDDKSTPDKDHFDASSSLEPDARVQDHDDSGPPAPPEQSDDASTDPSDDAGGDPPGPWFDASVDAAPPQGDDSGTTDPLPDASDDAATADQDTGVTPDPDEARAAAVAARFRECGVVSAQGEFNAGLVEDSFDRCIADCILQVSCPVFHGAMCEGSNNAFIACQNACYPVDGFPVPADGFRCTNGTTIAHVAVCDDGVLARYASCPGGEDEQGCAKFRCADGDMISAKYRCDGLSATGSQVSRGGCKDGSDEVGCATFCGN